MNADHLYIPRHELTKLEKVLREIPTLAIDLEISLTRQDRMGSEKSRQSKRRSTPMPFNMGASDALDILHNTVSTWVRLVCEQRGVAYMPPAYTHRHGEEFGPLLPTQRRMPPGYNEDNLRDLSKWLVRYIVSLAMTEGAEEALDEIDYAVKNARRSIDLPNRKVFQGVCESCTGSLMAYQIDKYAVCDDCGMVIDRDSNNARINIEIEGRLFTAKELETLVEAQLGVTVSRKRMYKWADPNEPANRTTGPKLITRGYAMGSNEKLFRAGDVFALVKRVPVAA